MMWLLPDDRVLASITVKEVRTVGEPALSTDKLKRWRDGPVGRVWRVKNRAKRNAYFRRYYAKNPARRLYLAMKQREYRAR